MKFVVCLAEYASYRSSVSKIYGWDEKGRGFPLAKEVVSLSERAYAAESESFQ